ncbi:dehydration-induced 19 -like protein [Gossypium arboreum]|uniref:Dehydration-induced 19-like protein n=1 Tax=Gossypium arboreum TaxID=29729 RepID=A0A0B0MTP1_GOSAR|nr:dehydration-induced 19 -like protein [Gossypium arboreum]
MDADSWSTRLSSVSKRYQFTLQSRSDMFMGLEEIDGEDDIREEFPSPFCSEHFDILSLCCHIDDEHPMEAKNGVCPVCAMKVEVDMHKRKSRKGGSHSMLSRLRKELREGNLQSPFGGSCILSSSNSAPDPLLSSFILPMVDDFVSVQPHFSSETSATEKSSDINKLERNVQSTLLSVEDQEEKTERCEFIQGLLLSTILDDIL